MRLHNFIKQSSERSDAYNWAKNILIENTSFYYDSIEGCNQNNQNATTHLLERAHVDIEEYEEGNKESVLNQIQKLEGIDRLDRKIRFARCFDLALTYVLYNDRSRLVFLLSISNVNDIEHKQSFMSYETFGDWLAEIKGWKSTKKFREYNDLPLIDRVLRENGTPWPTNIDCFCSDRYGNPLAIVEYQNADKLGVKNHDNNEYFLCKKKTEKETAVGKKTVFHDDIRRWTSQEILRVQSGLKLFVITWAKKECTYKLNEIDKIVFPDFGKNETKSFWKEMQSYKRQLHNYVKSPDKLESTIAQRKSMSFFKEDGNIRVKRNSPPLKIIDKSFPYIYWRRKSMVEGSKNSLFELFKNWVVE